jgi:hypothetical protein
VIVFLTKLYSFVWLLFSFVLLEWRFVSSLNKKFSLNFLTLSKKLFKLELECCWLFVLFWFSLSFIKPVLSLFIRLDFLRQPPSFFFLF